MDEQLEKYWMPVDLYVGKTSSTCMAFASYPACGVLCELVLEAIFVLRPLSPAIGVFFF